MKNKTFIVKYYFDGNGEAKIEAKSEEEARENFFKGEIVNQDEWGDDYNIADIQEEIEIK